MKIHLTGIPLILIAMFILTAVIYAKQIEFDFADPKGVNSMMIHLDSELEPIIGTAQGVSGTIKFDPGNPKSITGKLAVEAKSIHMTNQRMTKVLHSEDWMSIEQFPLVEFSFKEILEVQKKGDTRFELMARGDFTLKGITREIRIPFTLSFLQGKLADRQDGVEGDLLILRSNFDINRKDFNIKPDMGITTVANKINIHLGIAGIAPKK